MSDINSIAQYQYHTYLNNDPTLINPGTKTSINGYIYSLGQDLDI